MTVELTTPTARYTVAGIGPYALEWPYSADSITVYVEADGARTALVVTTSFTVTPEESLTTGDLYLTAPAAALHVGKALVIERVTSTEQGWQGLLGEREKGLEVQLDRTIMALQEVRATMAGALRVAGQSTPPVVLAEDQTILWQGGQFVPGPTAAQVLLAESWADSAHVSQLAAAVSAAAAAASALAAATFDPALYLAKAANLSGLADTDAAQTNLGGTATGKQLFTAADQAAARTAIAAAPLAGPSFTGQVKVPAGSVGAPSLIQAGDVDTGLWFPAANTLAVSLAGAEKARFEANYLRLAAGGIQFNGDTADANSLDDYEEGSFTPTISGAGVSGAGTYTLQTGRYVKVGKVVTIWGAVTITAHTGSGQMIIGGLPFTTANVANMKTVASILYLSLTVPAASFAVGFIGPNESWISMNSLATAAAGYVSLSLDAACTLNFTATYEAA
jgi:hypothetical protein